jgi:GNAT superfamily N-acetyltransferase
MEHAALAAHPQWELPAGFTLRFYEPGDAAHWVEIHRKADMINRITADSYRREFGEDESLLAQRQLFLLDADGGPIGTATAWLGKDVEQGWGRIHWVAIIPEYQGRGLGKPLMTAVANRLVELGHEKAYLMTSKARPKAIQLYLQCGFLLIS